ncbi:MAG: phosphatidylglycerophosphatase A [Alphaproteobacteria bacterium]
MKKTKNIDGVKSKKYLSRFHELILSFFYCGKSIFAPGTIGTIGGIIFWLYFNHFMIICNFELSKYNLWLFLINIFFTIYALKFIPNYVQDIKSKDIDHKSIVIDEVVGILIAIQIFHHFSYPLFILNDTKFLIYLLLIFLIFRFLDIKKPLIIGYCDQKLKNPFGIMLDDILCGIFSGFIVTVIYFYTSNSNFFRLINCE